MSVAAERLERKLKICQQAGYDLTESPPDERTFQKLNRLLEMVGADPDAVVAAALRAERQCRRAAEAAAELEKALARLAAAPAVLCRVEGLAGAADDLRVLCVLGGQLRELPIHPDVAPERLRRLAPWQLVRVAVKEQIVVGVCDAPDLWPRSLGEVVDFRAYFDREAGLVRVARPGREDEIVRLAPALRNEKLRAPMKLVLHRDAPHWAVATAPAEEATSKFETPVDRIQTRLEDLAGLEAVIEPLVEDLLLRLVRQDLARRFDLEPLRGVLLYSYQPGMGKTQLVRALARLLYDLGRDWDFDVVLYVVKPNELKIVWHGGDARLVREELCGAIRARQAAPRERPLFQLVVFDEIDSLGKRVGGGGSGPLLSPAQNDAVQALLAEMDGVEQWREADGDGPPAHVLWIGLTNRPDMVDEALKRPGRFGDFILEFPALTLDSAAGIMAVYARSPDTPWLLGGRVRTGAPLDEVRDRLLRPAVERVFPRVVLRGYGEGRCAAEATAGQILAGVHYKHAMNAAKKRAAKRALRGGGPPAIAFDDIVEGLVDQTVGHARSLLADRDMLRRQLGWDGSISRVEAVSRRRLAAAAFVEPDEDEAGDDQTE